MSKGNRGTFPIRCVGCNSPDAYERRRGAGLWELFCPDCGAVFGWGSLPRECRGCKAALRRTEDRARGQCNTCYIQSWSPEKRAAINSLIGMAFRKPEPTDEQKDKAVDEAFKHPEDEP